MKHLYGLLLTLCLILTWSPANAQGEFRFGLIGKAEFNRLSVENADRQPDSKFEGIWGAAGLYTAVDLGKRCFLDASVLLSRAKYSPNYASAGAVFMDADVRFTQCNLNLNIILNPNAEKVGFFIFGGGQFLYRRWGEERYIEDIIPKTYWPSIRIMTQAGMGAKCAIGRGFYLQPFAGLRYAMDQQLVYDISMNQVFTGVVLAYGMKGKKKNRYNKCPTEF